jgi:hypothetical protein
MAGGIAAVFQENPLGMRSFSCLKEWETGWGTWWVMLDVAKCSEARVLDNRLKV